MSTREMAEVRCGAADAQSARAPRRRDPGAREITDEDQLVSGSAVSAGQWYVRGVVPLQDLAEIGRSLVLAVDLCFVPLGCLLIRFIRWRWVDVGRIAVRALLSDQRSQPAVSFDLRRECGPLLMRPINARELWRSWIGLSGRAHHSTITDFCIPQASEPSRLSI